MSKKDIRKSLAKLVGDAWGIECEENPLFDDKESGSAFIENDVTTRYEQSVSGGRSDRTHTFTVVTYVSVIGGENPAEESKELIDARIESLIEALEADVRLGGEVLQAVPTQAIARSAPNADGGVDSGAEIEIEVIE